MNLTELLNKEQELKQELAQTTSFIEDILFEAREVMSTANSLGITLSDEQGNIDRWAKDCLDYGFGDFEEDEAEEMSDCVYDIIEYSEQIELILQRD